jgi:hypothetical protein
MRIGVDYYEVLQVSAAAEPEVIQAAYRKLCTLYHPDVNKSPLAEEKMRLINEAYGVLSDPSRRAEYDAARAAQGERAGPASSDARGVPTPAIEPYAPYAIDFTGDPPHAEVRWRRDFSDCSPKIFCIAFFTDPIPPGATINFEWWHGGAVRFRDIVPVAHARDQVHSVMHCAPGGFLPAGDWLVRIGRAGMCVGESTFRVFYDEGGHASRLQQEEADQDRKRTELFAQFWSSAHWAIDGAAVVVGYLVALTVALPLRVVPVSVIQMLGRWLLWWVFFACLAAWFVAGRPRAKRVAEGWWSDRGPFTAAEMVCELTGLCARLAARWWSERGGKGKSPERE